jgi:hypothetical protein
LRGVLFAGRDYIHTWYFLEGAKKRGGVKKYPPSGKIMGGAWKMKEWLYGKGV